MKKKIIIAALTMVFLTGCQKASKDNIVKRLENKIESSSYKLQGNMRIYSNEEQYDYDINVISKKGEKFVVNLTNENNSHEQIILKNEDGVYVITPSLNKSFKFQSKWPNNGSQSYILESLLNDIKNDKDKDITEEEKNIIIKCKVNYPNNPDLIYQKIIVDQSGNIKKVTVYDENDTEKIIVSINDIDFKSSIKEEEFLIDNYINNDINNQENCENEECDKKTINEIDEIIYPLYIPNNTYLKSSDKIDTEEVSRAILSFNGDQDFVIVEQTSVVNNEFEVIPVSGDPYILANSVAALGNNSLYFSNLGIDYYITSSTLSSSEMLNIAASLSNSVAVMESK